MGMVGLQQTAAGRRWLSVYWVSSSGPSWGCWTRRGPVINRPAKSRRSETRPPRLPGGIHRQGDRRGMGKSGSQAGAAGDGRGVPASRLSRSARPDPEYPGGAGLSEHPGARQAGEAGRVSAQSSRLRQELRDPVDRPPDRPRQPGSDGRPRGTDQLAAQAVRLGAALERGRS